MAWYLISFFIITVTTEMSDPKVYEPYDEPTSALDKSVPDTVTFVVDGIHHLFTRI